jgi:carbonyl reductase 1
MIVCNLDCAASQLGPFGHSEAVETLATNYFGTRAVTDAFSPILAASAGRVINLASVRGGLRIVSAPLQARFAAPDISRRALDELVREFEDTVRDGSYEAKGWPRSTYGVSKLAEIALTKLLARELAATGVMVVCMCPGQCRTDMAGSLAPRSAEEGAETAVYLATTRDALTAGAFYEDKRVSDW